MIWLCLLLIAGCASTPEPETPSFPPVVSGFNWTPKADQVGTHTIRFTASDGELEDYEDVPLTVIPN